MLNITNYSVQFSSVAQLCPTLWPHGLQHARPPCPSPTPRVHSDSCPLSRWCHPTTVKGQFSFQSQRKAMPKNAQTTAQLHSSHMLVKQCSKFSKPDFSNTWIVNFQMFKLVLEKAEEPEIKLPNPRDHRKSKKVPEKNVFLLYWLCQSLWLCGSQ